MAGSVPSQMTKNLAKGGESVKCSRDLREFMVFTNFLKIHEWEFYAGHCRPLLHPVPHLKAEVQKEHTFFTQGKTDTCVEKGKIVLIQLLYSSEM